MAESVITVYLKFRREAGKVVESAIESVTQLGRAANKTSKALNNVGSSDEGLKRLDKSIEKIESRIDRLKARKASIFITLGDSAAKASNEVALIDAKLLKYNAALQVVTASTKKFKEVQNFVNAPAPKIKPATNLQAYSDIKKLNNEILVARRKLAVQQNADFKKQQRELERIRAKTELIKKENLGNDKALQKINGRLKGMNSAIKNSVGSLSSLAKIFAVVLAGLAIRGIVTQLRETSVAVAEIQTITDKTVESTKTLNDSLGEISRTYGTSFTTNAKALYQIISAGAQAGAQANDLLNVSIKAAIAGITDAETAADGLTTIINAWGIPFSHATEIADKLFTTVKLGKVTFDELSKFMFQVAPVASALGVSFDEVSASIIAITKQGTPGRVALTQVRQAMQGLIREIPALTKIFLDNGFASGKAALQTLGLAGTLKLIKTATNGNVAEMQKLIGSIEGLQGALALTSDQGIKFFSEGAQALADSAGAMEEAFQTVNETIDTKFNKALESGKTTLLAIGQATKEFIVTLVDGFESISESIRGFAEEYPKAFSGLSTVLAVAGAGFVSLIAIIKSFQIIKAIAAGFSALGVSIAGAAEVTGIFGIALRGLGAAITFIISKFFVITAVISAVIFAYNLFFDATEKVRSKAEELNKTLSDANGVSDASEKIKIYADVMAETRKEMDRIEKAIQAERIALTQSIKEFGESSVAAEKHRIKIQKLNKQHGELIKVLKKATSEFKSFQKQSDKTSKTPGFAGTIIDALIAIDAKVLDTKRRIEELKLKEATFSANGQSGDAALALKERTDLEGQLQKLESDRVKQSINLQELEAAKIKETVDAIKARIKLETQLGQAEVTLKVNDIQLKDADLRRQLQQRKITFTEYYDQVQKLTQEKLDARVSVVEQHASRLRKILSVLPDTSKTAQERRKLGAELIQVESQIQQAVAARLNDQIRKVTQVNEKLKQLANERFSIESRFSDITRQLQERDLTAREVVASRINRIEELQSQKRVAIRKGEFAQAKRIINQIVGLYQGLSGTISGKDDTKAVATEQDRAKVIREITALKKDLLGINDKNTEKLKAQKKAQQDSVEVLKQQLEEARKAVETSKIEFKIDDSDLQELYDEVNQVHQQVIKADLDNASVKQVEAELDKLTKDRVAHIKVSNSGGGQGFATGGYVRGKGTTTSDSIFAPWLSDREFVLPAKAVSHYGLDFLEKLRTMRLPRFATGGLVGSSTVSKTVNNFISDVGSGLRDSVDLNLNFGGNSFNLQGSRDVVNELTEALKRQQLMSPA